MKINSNFPVVSLKHSRSAYSAAHNRGILSPLSPIRFLRSLKPLALIVFLYTFLCSTFAYAFESFVIKEIRLEGLQKYSEQTIYNYLPIKVGDTLSEASSSEVIRQLFNTGFFQEVNLARDNDILVVQLQERPVIGSLQLTGNKDLPTDMLVKNFKQMGVVEGETFNRATLESIRNDLEKLYASHGKYGVYVETKVTDLPRNRVKIEIIINEGFVSRIKQINFCGNRHFPKSVLLKQMTLSTATALSWYNKTDEFDQEKLSNDLAKISSFYADKGYAQFRILSAPIAMSADRQCVFVTINVSEGKRYTLNKLSIQGELPVPECELEPYLKLIKPGSCFSRSQIIALAKAITDHFGVLGYAFAHVDPIPEFNEETCEINIVFHVQAGKKVYVRRIDFEGNVKTEDNVLRKYGVQLEGAPISTPKIEATKVRYDRTGFFSEVKSNMTPVPMAPDQVDILYSVKEAPTGSITGGIGYSSEDQVLLNAKASNRNIFGTGKNLDLDLNYTRAAVSCNLGYNNPFYTLDGISRGFNVFYSRTSLGETAPITNYTTDVYGANLNYGIPLTEYQRITFIAGLQNTKLTFPKDSALPIEIKAFLDAHAADCTVMAIDSNKACNFKELNLAMGWTYNSLDRFVFPQKGMSHTLGLNATTPLSNLEYYKVSYTGQYYKPLGYSFIGLLLLNAGYGYGYGNTNDLPFFKNYYLGGSKSLRGFEEGSLGPTDSLGRPFGGNVLFNGTLGLILPELIAPETHSVRTTIFLDFGQLYHCPDLDYSYGLSSNGNGFRYSLGGSITWISPIGPLTLNVAYPLNAKKGDKQNIVSVAFGTVF